METKVVVMPLPPKRRLRIRIGSSVYEVRVDVEIALLPLRRAAALIVMPSQAEPISK
jgi:hypothetical protein